MAKPLLPDALWERIGPLLPKEPAKPKGSRPRVPDRAALTGILFVLKTGTPWEYLPPGNGLWFRHDVLASPSRLAHRRRLEQDLARAARRTWLGRRHRLEHVRD